MLGSDLFPALKSPILAKSQFYSSVLPAVIRGPAPIVGISFWFIEIILKVVFSHWMLLGSYSFLTLN